MDSVDVFKWMNGAMKNCKEMSQYKKFIFIFNQVKLKNNIK